MLLKAITGKNIWFATSGFLTIGSNFKILYDCHDLVMLYLKVNYIAITTVKGVDYCCIILDITKSETIYLLENSVFEDCG